MNRFFIALIFLCALSVISCSAKEEPVTREQELKQGFKLIDEKNYDEAIAYFADLNQKNPHYQVRLAWASAYAARAGVMIENIWAFTMEKPKDSRWSQLQNLPLDQRTNALLKSYGEYLARWNQVPLVSSDKSDDLINALNILSVDSEPGVRLYSACLRVVLLKSTLSEGLESWSHLERQKLCVRDVQPYWDWSLRILDNLRSLAYDLEISFPKQKEQYQNIQDNIEAVQRQMASLPLPAGDKCF